MNAGTTIFLGSSFEDLEHHRQLILTALAALKQEVEAMEYWEPSGDTPVEASLQRVRDSQIYIGILGTRYGTVVRDGKSITQLEYEAAEAAKLKRLVYLLDEEHHPIVYKHVDTGENAEKLQAFKRLAQRSVVGRFSSSQDLVAKVVTHLVRTLDGLGSNVRAALLRNGVSELAVPAGFTYGMHERRLNAASILEMQDNGLLQVADPIVEKTLAAGVIASALSKGEFKILADFVTFDPEIYRSILALLRIFGYDEESFAQEIRSTSNAFSLRVLIALAGDLGMQDCAEAICQTLVLGRSFQRQIQRQDLQVTPFNDVAIRALQQLPAEAVRPVAAACLEHAKRHELWAEKRAVEKVIKFHEQEAAGQ